MAAITSLTGPRHISPVPHFSEGVLNLMKEIGSKFGFDSVTRDQYQDEICTVLVSCFFKESQLFSLRTQSLLEEGREEVIPFVIFFIFVAYVIDDKKSDEFPEFFGKILDDEMKEGLEMVRQFSRECGGELLVLPKLRILKRDQEQLNKEFRLGPLSSLQDILASFILIPNKLFRSSLLPSCWWQMQPQKKGNAATGVTSIMEARLAQLTQLAFSCNKTGKITLGVTTKLGLDPIEQYQTYEAINECIVQNLLQIPPKASSLFKEEEEETISLIVFWFMVLYVSGRKSDQLPLQVLDKFLDEASREKLGKIPHLKGYGSPPKPEDLVLEHRKFYENFGLSPSSSMKEILRSFIDDQHDGYHFSERALLGSGLLTT